MHDMNGYMIPVFAKQQTYNMNKTRGEGYLDKYLRIIARAHTKVINLIVNDECFVLFMRNNIIIMAVVVVDVAAGVRFQIVCSFVKVPNVSYHGRWFIYVCFSDTQ